MAGQCGQYDLRPSRVAVFTVGQSDQLFSSIGSFLSRQTSVFVCVRCQTSGKFHLLAAPTHFVVMMPSHSARGSDVKGLRKALQGWVLWPSDAALQNHPK